MADAERTDGTREDYSPGYGVELVASYGTRSIGIQAAFFVRHLRPDMRILDCGCGPGSITRGLAKFACQGHVTGVDVSPEQLQLAHEAASKRGLVNIGFEAASIYELPFADDAFDAVLAHAVFQHLGDPEAALKEMHRVVKPGGVVGLRDDDVGSLILAPDLPGMDRVLAVIHGIVCLSGGNPMVGRHFRKLLRRTGFRDIVVSTTTECDETAEATRERGDLAAALLEHMRAKAIENGLSSAEEMPRLIEAVRAWGRHPDAFDAIIWCEAVARKA